MIIIIIQAWRYQFINFIYEYLKLVHIKVEGGKEEKKEQEKSEAVYNY